MKLKELNLGSTFFSQSILVFLVPFFLYNYYPGNLSYLFLFCTPDMNDVSANTIDNGYSAVPFSYGSSSDPNDQKIADMESGFHPPFPVPDYLLQNLVCYCFVRLFPLAIC